MGFFSNLFAKKNCSICGNEIGLLGNRKLEDGNMCKNCASKLSPWFSERRSSTVAQIEEQLAYREENKEKVAQFHVTRSLGLDNTKVLLDEDKGQFLVSKTRQWREENPDVLSFDQVTGCVVDIDESEREEMQDGPDNKKVSYEPRRYTYYYDFYVKISVNHPYFDQIKFRVNSSSVTETYQDRMRYNMAQGRTGQPPMSRSGSTLENILGAVVNTVAAANSTVTEFDGHGVDYREGLETAYAIRDALTQLRQQAREEILSAAAPKTNANCPCCGALTTPTENGCCEYCGTPLSG